MTIRRVQSLARLQAVDLEAEDCTRRLEEYERRIADDPVVAALLTQAAAHQKELSAQRAKLTSTEIEAKMLAAKITDLERRLYGGSVSNPKELESLQKELDQFKRIRGESEDRLLGLLDAVDQWQRRADEQQQRVEQAQSTRGQELNELLRQRDTAKTRLNALQSERTLLRSALDAGTLRSYDHLKRTKTGRAVATIRRGACSICGVAVPTGHVSRIQAGEEIVFCTSCGRILAE